MKSSVLAQNRRVGIDSNILIYLLEGSSPLADAAGALLDGIAAGDGEGVLSTLAIAEVATGPARLDDTALVHRYAEELASLENVRVAPVDVAIAVEAALIRGAGNLTLSDAIHLATARLAGASVFVTNDRRIGAIAGLEVAYLDDQGGDRLASA